MFYCNKCRDVNGYPETLFRSYGPCEICGDTAQCNEAHHDAINAIDMLRISRMMGGM
jgi:hypothetical protein